MKKLFLLLALLTLSVGMWAETQNVSYCYPVYNTEDDAASGIKEWETASVVATVVENTSEQVTWTAGWYVVTGTDVELSKGAICQGDVRLILADGAKLTASTAGTSNYPGIQVSDTGNSLTIYGQTAQTGQLIATGGNLGGAGIGGRRSGTGSNITINGGIITATTAGAAAGIGGGYGGSGSNITINGGTVTATGGSWAAGIGGGPQGNGFNITINGGTINANGGQGGAGIGGGDGSSSHIGANGSNITINGGTITANGGDKGAGIGGGQYGNASHISINGCTVTATGGIDGGSGIGSGKNGSASSNISVAITYIVKAGNSENPADEIANAGSDLATGLSGKQYVTIELRKCVVTYGDNVTVSPSFASGTVIDAGTQITFTAADRSSDNIDFWGFYAESTFDTPITTGVSDRTYTVTLTNADISVYAKYFQRASYIDGKGVSHYMDAWVVDNVTDTPVTWGKAGETAWYVVTGKDVKLSKGAVCHGNVNLILADGAKLTATGEKWEAGIQVSGEGNSFTIYGQSNQSGQLEAIGEYYAAGIGGRCEQAGSNITINGGIVKASGGFCGAGIGGGNKESGSKITINGGTIMTNGGVEGAGIGGGVEGYGSDITINGGKVIANGGEYASGIGGGESSFGSNIRINGGTVFATGNDGGDCIGNGSSASSTSSGIFVATTHFARVGKSKNSVEAITNTGNDLAESMKNKLYAIIDTMPAVSASYYIDKEGVSHNTDAYVVADASLATVTWGAAGQTTWYVVAGKDLNITQGAICVGNVNLILADGAKLTVTGDVHTGILVSGEGNSLTIYGQSNQSGQLEASGGTDGAGIGGEYFSSGSNITINGGKVTAKGGSAAAGIGGGYCYSNGSNITINGGTVTAIGGYEGAGIGSGYYMSNGTDITITGGIVIATGGEEAAGIGGGYTCYGSNITITGGIVIATGGLDAAGIGGGYTCHGSNITITGGTVIATGGTYGDGIGNGYAAYSTSSDIFVTTNNILKADGKNPPTTVIENNGEDLASSLRGKQYVIVTEPVFNLTANQDPQHKENYYATFYSSWNAYQVPEDVTAYTGAVDGDVLKLTSITDGIIPAGQGVILQKTSEDNTATKQEIVLAVTTETGTWGGTSALKGTDVEKILEANQYALSLGQNGVGFYLWEGKSIGANKAYLTLSDTEAKALMFEFNDEPSGIKDVQGSKFNDQGPSYNLNGMRVGDNYKGIVIKNGKKYVVK